MLSPDEALERLRAGNARFVDSTMRTIPMPPRSDEAVKKQTPFAIVIGCSDSRVPAEILFDQGIGDLFIVRVAGNVVTPTQLGSVEFAVQQFGTRLIVVLGHTHCGAVQAALQAQDSPDGALSPNLQAIVDCIAPAVAGAADPIRANVMASVARVQADSTVIAEQVAAGQVKVAGAEYCLQSGEVTFLPA